MRALLLLVASAVLALAPASAAQPPNAADLEAELVCPVCDTTLDQSNAPIAERMKLYIRERIAAGDTEREIKAALVAEFGPGVLATPEKSGFGLVAWLLPLVAIVAGLATVTLLARSWARGRAPERTTTSALEPELERRVDEELARFEG